MIGLILTWGKGRARDAVEDNIGVARDDDKIAGTDGDFAIFARRAARSAAGELGVVAGG